MAFTYDFDRLNILLKEILQRNLTTGGWQWLMTEGESARVKNDVQKFNIAFVAMPRKTGKAVIQLATDDEKKIKSFRKGLQMNGWTTDRLSRAWLLMQLNPDNKEKYISAIESLFINGEMSELVALYGSLPLLAYAESWAKRCAEGVRSNIGEVLESIICNNPLPSEVLDEAAWNQLVLKAIFTEKPLLQIVGLKERMNERLARSLSDYAHERWAAHRDLNPLVWICVAPFIGPHNFSDIERIFRSDRAQEREAAALVCYQSGFEPARKLLEEDQQLKGDVEAGRVSWRSIASGIGQENV